MYHSNRYGMRLTIMELYIDVTTQDIHNTRVNEKYLFVILQCKFILKVSNKPKASVYT